MYLTLLSLVMQTMQIIRAHTSGVIILLLTTDYVRQRK